jgi:hypothetical protein
MALSKEHWSSFDPQLYTEVLCTNQLQDSAHGISQNVVAATRTLRTPGVTIRLAIQPQFTPFCQQHRNLVLPFCNAV